MGRDAIEDLRTQLPRDFAAWHATSRAQYLEAAHLLPGYILSSQGDRVSLAHAVEGRFPFLDHRVVEFAAKIPPRFRMKGLHEKHILRKSMERHLPKTIADRPKQPYRAPDSASFFTSAAPDYVGELLSPRAIARTGYFDSHSSIVSSPNADPAPRSAFATTWPWSAFSPSSCSTSNSSSQPTVVTSPTTPMRTPRRGCYAVKC